MIHHILGTRQGKRERQRQLYDKARRSLHMGQRRLACKIVLVQVEPFPAGSTHRAQPAGMALSLGSSFYSVPPSRHVQAGEIRSDSLNLRRPKLMLKPHSDVKETDGL